LHPFNAEGTQLEDAELPLVVHLVRGQESQDATIVAVRPVHAGWLIRFQGLDSRDAVAALVGREVHLPGEAFAPLGEAEFFVEEIVGCEVVLGDGQRLGRVSSTFWNGAQDVMTIVADDGSERMLPVVPAYVCSFQREHRRLVVDLHE
jgi:16S rRNA processing protein RimM